jgi:hypothetical protein
MQMLLASRVAGANIGVLHVFFWSSKCGIFWFKGNGTSRCLHQRKNIEHVFYKHIP